MGSLFKKPKAPQPTAAQLDLEAAQRVDSAELDKLENERRKRLLAASQGIRAFRGSALTRAKPGNRAAGAATGSTSGGSLMDSVDIAATPSGKYY